LGGIKKGEKKAINMNKTSKVFQGPDESPTSYMSTYVRLSIYTPTLTQKPLKTSR
jgi:hypothetical protein